MEKLSLYRKYRPKDFDNLVGQDYIKTTLINAIKSKQISHSYIFSGPRGTGKTTTARLMAKAINCENLINDFEPCNKCDLCNDINKGSLIDVIEIDAASNTSVDDVRELKENTSFAPTRSKAKVYIIDEFHMLSKSAFNALLKTLEEPPANVYFILATTELHKIPETIISRCQNFEFKRISMDSLSQRLNFIAHEEGIVVEENALKLISKYSNGGLRDAISLLEQLSISENITEDSVSKMLGISSIELINGFYKVIKEKDTQNALKFIDTIIESGVDLRQFIHDFINLLREKVMLCFSENYLNAVPLYMNLIEHFQKAIKEFNPEIPRLALEMATIRATFDFQKISLVKDIPINNENTASESKSEVKHSHENAEVSDKKEEIKEKMEQANVLKNDLSEKTNSNPLNPNNSSENKSLESSSDIDSIKENWINVLNHISKPTISRSLRTGKPIEINGDSLLLKFFSSFHNEIVMKTESKMEIEKSILDVTGKSVRIKSIVEEKAIEDETSTATNFEKKSPISSPAPKNNDKPEIDKATSEALSIFGAKLV